MQNAQILPLAKRLGLVPVPPQPPTHEALKKWLVKYGSLWTNATEHIVVIAGMRGNTDDDETITLRVYDPWPPKRGRIYLVGYARWMREVPTRTYLIFTRT